MILLILYIGIFLMIITGLCLFGTIRNLRKLRSERELLLIITRGGKR